MFGRKTIGGVRTIELWWRWRESNINVVVVASSSTIREAVSKKLSVGSMWGRCRVDRRSMYLRMEKYIE